MKHYFRVVDISKNQNQRKKRNFFLSWLYGLSITGLLIFLNVVAFFAAQIALMLNSNMINFFALSAENLFANNYWWALVTSMFMHANFFHLFVNMFSLYFIGKFLEMLIGKRRYFWLYMLSGIFAGLFFAVLSFLFGAGALGAKIFSSPATLAVGASGALFGIAGVLAFLTPKNRVYLIAGPLVALIIQAVIMGLTKNQAILNIVDIAVMIYIFIAIFAMFSFNPSRQRISLPIEMPFWLLPIAAIVPLVIIGLFVELPIGNMAHLGGFIAGSLYGIYLRLRYKRKTRIISEYFSK